MSNRFHHEDDIQAAYEAAEFVIMGMVQRNTILVPDERQPAKRETIRKVARAVADAVIRTNSVDEDITTVLGVNVERVN